ncbi:27447_t:CDS:2, partial [Gigaspora margarita]
MTGISSSTHIADILSLSENPDLDQALKIENEFKLILVLLVNSGPDKNPRYLKNIEEYSYNLVERSMSTLSEKLGEIVLSVDHFGSHFDTMGNITDSNLELHNFNYA